jgi:hypothetical protein
MVGCGSKKKGCHGRQLLGELFEESGRKRNEGRREVEELKDEEKGNTNAETGRTRSIAEKRKAAERFLTSRTPFGMTGFEAGSVDSWRRFGMLLCD